MNDESVLIVDTIDENHCWPLSTFCLVDDADDLMENCQRTVYSTHLLDSVVALGAAGEPR